MNSQVSLKVEGEVGVLSHKTPDNKEVAPSAAKNGRFRVQTGFFAHASPHGLAHPLDVLDGWNGLTLRVSRAA